VVELSFNNNYFFILLLLFQLESLIFISFKNVIFFIKKLNISLKPEKDLNNGISLSTSFILLWFIFILINFKCKLYFYNIIINLFIFYVIYYILINYYKSISKFYFSVHILLLFFITYILSFFFIVNFLEFFILIELYSTLYFFFYSYQKTLPTNSLNSYKINLSLLLWNNFLTSLLMFISLYFFLSENNSTNFNELFFFKNSENPIYIFMLGIFFKVGLPSFHFFKYEVYLYLNDEYIFLFPLITSLININILLTFVSINIVNIIISQEYFLYLISITLILFIVNNIKSSKITNYIATSSIITISTIFIINLSILYASSTFKKKL